MTKSKAKMAEEAAASKRERGRPSMLTADKLVMVRTLAGHGISEVRMQSDLGVSERTWRRWKTKHPEFVAALRVSDAEMLEIARSSVVKRMQGYDFRAVKIITVPLGAGMGSEVREVPYVEHVPPDTTAAMWVMKNRDPAAWKDRRDAEQPLDVVVRVEGGLPEEEPGAK